MSFAVTNVSSSSGSANINVEEIAGTTTSVDNGTADAGTQRVVVASDNSPIPISDGGSSITVDGTVTANAGTGTFAISAAALPLPSGASTEATLSALNAKVTAVNTGAVVISSSALPSGASTSALQTTGNTSLASIDSKLTNPLPISATSLPLPTGAATSALQTQPGVDIGDVTINNASGASAVNIQDGGNSITVDGTISATQSGTWNITNISGTVSLPTGASTSANQTSELTKLDTLHTDLVSVEGKQDTGNASLASIDTKVPSNLTVTSTRLLVDGSGVTQPVSDGGGSLTVDGTVAATQSGTWNINNISGTVSLPTGAATETTLSSLNSKVTAVNTEAVVVSSSALPTGAATSALQTTGNTSVASIDTKFVADTVSITGTLPPTISGTVELNIEGYSSALIQVGDGQGSAVVSAVYFFGSADGTNWITLSGCDVVELDGQIPANTNFQKVYVFNVAGMKKIKAYGLGSDIGIVIRAAKNPAVLYQILAITYVNATISSSALPTGASTSALQTTGNTSLSSIDTKTPALGQAAMASSTPVVIASNQSAVPVSGTLTAVTTVTNLSQLNGAAIAMGTGTRSAGTQRVTIATDDIVPASQSGTWTVQPGNTANTTAWKVDGSAVTQPVSLASVPSHAVTNAGTFAVQATVAAGATTIGKAEDVASADADVGVPAMAIQKATPADTAGTDGDYSMLQMSAGRLWASSKIDTALPAGTNVIGHVINDTGSTTAVTGNVTVVQGTGTNLHTVIDSGTVSTITNVVHVDDNSGSLTVDNGGTFAVQATVAAGATNIAKAEDVAFADADVGVPAMAIRKATPANTSGTDGDYEMLQISAGRLWTSSTVDAALPTGTNSIGQVTSNAGTNTSTANLDVALSTRLKPADTLTAVTTVTSLTQLNGAAIAMNTGTRSAGTQRVTIATDDVVPASQSGTWNIGTLTTLTGITNALPAGTNAIGKLSANSGVDIGDVDITSIAAGTNRLGSVRLVDSADADLTSAKSSQTSRAIGTQDLKDAGRTHVTYYATGAASGTTTTETAISITKSSGTSGTSAANSQTPASGKKYRITAITVASRGNVTATAQVTTFNLRINTGGAVITSSTPVIISIRSATPATALAWDRVFIEIPEGLEIAGDGTLQIGITANAVFVTNAPTWDVLITGYEY